MPELDGVVEPEIIINGTKLSFGQAMTVRVAIESFAMYISNLPAKERAGIFNSYAARIDEMRQFIFRNQPRKR